MKPVRTRLREAIIYNLRRITTTQDYFNTIGEVFSEPKAPDAIKAYPAIHVGFGPHQCLNADEGTLTQGFELQYKVLVNLTIYIKKASNPEETRESIVTDIQKLFGKGNGAEQIPDDCGEPTCYECMFGTDEPIGQQETSPFIGHKIELWVWYRQDMRDPTKIA